MPEPEISSQFAIQTHALSFSYGNYKALDDISLQMPTGSIFGFLGPNGAGKSTTIKVLLGLLRSTHDKVFIFGKELNTNKMNILRMTGAMVETPSLYDHLNARQNLELVARLRNLPFDRIGYLLDIVSLTQDAKRRIRQYSTGMRQRLSLAIAMLAEPRLLILDEPINGLDPNGIIEIRNLLLRINQENNCSILLSSHILSEIEKICSHVAIINSGSLVFQGSMDTLLNAAKGRLAVEISTNDNQRSAALLSAKLTVATQKNSFVLHVDSKDEIAAAIRMLVNEGMEIYSAEKQTTGIEASFLHMLNENRQS